MNMAPPRLIALLAAGCILGSEDPWVASAQTADGWSETRDATIATFEGSLAVQKRSRPIPGDVVESVYCPPTQALLVGLAGERSYLLDNVERTIAPLYFAVGGRIASANARRPVLDLRWSITVAAEDVTKVADQWVEDYRQRMTRQSWSEGLVQFDLTAIFGSSVIIPAPSGSAPFSIEKLEVGADRVRFALRSYGRTETIDATRYPPEVEHHDDGGEDLEVVFSPDFDLLSASRSGKPTVPLWDGRLSQPNRLDNSWYGGQCAVAATNGVLDVPTCAKRFFAGSEEVAPGVMALKPALPYVSSLRVAAMPTGDLWIGPSSCRLAWLEGRVLGFTIFAATGELVVYSGPRLRIPMADAERIPACRKVLAQVEREVESGTFPRADRVVKVSDLYGADEALAKADNLRVASVGIEGNRAVIEARGSGQALRILMTPDLDVVAADRLPYRPGSR